MALATPHLAQGARRRFLAGFEIPALEFARRAAFARLARGEIPVRWWISEPTRMVPPHRQSFPAENCSLVDLLLALAEFDSLGVWRQLGHASLFDFLHREVGLSRGSAYYRQVASRLLGKFPEIAEPLRDGRLCISNVPQLAKVMTEENRATVVAKFFHCSKEEARQVVAEILPAEVVPTRTVVTVIAPVKPATAIVQPVGRDQPPPEGDRPASEVRRTVVEPLTRTETRMHVTVSPGFLALLKKAKAGQSHVQPGATDEKVLTAALQLLIAEQEKRRASVPPKVKREVRKRDGGKCTWPLANGGTCGSEIRTEIDHVVPAEGAARPRSTTAGSSATSITGKPRAKSTATPTWTFSLHVYRAHPSRSRHGSHWSGFIVPPPWRGASPWIH